MLKKIKMLVCLLLPLVVLMPKPVIAEPAEIREQTINELITEYAKIYRVDETVLHKVIKCESNYNPNAHNSVGENSWGLVQINLNAHRSITVEQATDPNFAINFLAKNIKAGKGKMWSCYK